MIAENKNVLAITHKGVMRALYALASGWDMRGKPAHRLADNALHEFALDGSGFRIGRLNMPLPPQAHPAEAAS
jgi:probable phosphoglycerate mutase